jgi:hypothetical protein
MGLDKFSAALDLLKGFQVNLYVGEDVFKGKLIGVEADHVVLETENKYIFYYSIDKIQAITKNTRQFQPEKTTVSFLKTQSLKDLLHSFQHTWVTILSINKQKFTGVLSEIDTDFATLINGEERILIKLTHVSNILKGFIKEETKKSSSSNENDKNNKSESKDQASASSEKDDSKSDEKSKSDSNSKEESKSSEKKRKASNREEKSDKKKESAVKEDIVEPNNTMVWSQPIKIEAAMVQPKEENSSNIFKAKKSHAEEKDSAKPATEMKKSNNENENKSEEAKASKSKPIEPSNEMKSVKEAVSILKTDNTPAPPLQLKQEVKPTKTQETAKVVSSQGQAAKKTESKTNDSNGSNNNQNVGKQQKEQEQKVFRFAGEPVNDDSQRAFPFAGWPNRNNRTSKIFE